MSNLMADLPRLTKRSALFLDFDGTLAPIQDDPDTVAMPGETLAAINRLQPFVAEAICIISGRDIRDLSSRVPIFTNMEGAVTREDRRSATVH